MSQRSINHMSRVMWCSGVKVAACITIAARGELAGSIGAVRARQKTRRDVQQRYTSTRVVRSRLFTRVIRVVAIWRDGVPHAVTSR